MFKPAETINTDQLVLRKSCLDDAQSIFDEYATDAIVTKYLSWKTHQSVSETEQFLSDQISRWETGAGYAWSISLTGEKNTVGMIDLRINGLQAECGYVLAKSRWGHGFMTETLIAIKDLAFKETEIERFQMVCDVENLASARVMEKAGFEKEGILRRYFLHPNIDTIPRDCLCYSAIRNR